MISSMAASYCRGDSEKFLAYAKLRWTQSVGVARISRGQVEEEEEEAPQLTNQTHMF